MPVGAASDLDAALIEHDAFDRSAFREVLTQTSRLRDAAETGARLLPHFEALVFDLFLACYKLNVLPREEAMLPASARLRSRILRHVLDSPDYRAMLDRTALDEPRSAHAAATLAETVVSLLTDDELLDGDDLLEQFALAEQEEALEALRELESSAQELLRQLPGAEETDLPLARVVRELETDRQGRESSASQKQQEAIRRIADLPPRLSTRLEQSVSGLPDSLDEAEAQVEVFGRGLGAGGRVPANDRIALGEKLRRSEKLRRLAAVVGAMRDEALDARRIRTERMVDELFDVELGSRLERVLPVELVALRHPILRRDFLRRLNEGRLQSYALSGSRRGRGPMIAIVDVSSSMAGAKELWAKGVALTLVDIARRQGRAFRALTFSSPPAPVRPFRPLSHRSGPGGRRETDLKEVVAFAEHFPGGGTDFSAPLDLALETLAESRFRRGDLVLITDGEAALSPPWREAFLKQKKKLGFKLFAVLVDKGHHGARVFDGLADELVRVSELTTGDARRIFERV